MVEIRCVSRYVVAGILGILCWQVAVTGWAHSGRRFNVMSESIGGMVQLCAEGYISTGSDDGGGVTRPYKNAIHDHWTNIFGAATASLPGFDVLSPGLLGSYGLDLELVGVTKWVSPPLIESGGMMIVPPGTVPDLVPLSGETLFVSKDAQLVTSASPGVLTLSAAIDPMGDHIDLVYGIDLEPSDVLYSLEFILSTDAPGVLDSDPVYAVIAPAGATMVEKMHRQALYLESYLGGAGSGMPMVPEPSAMVLSCLALLAGLVYGRFLGRRSP